MIIPVVFIFLMFAGQAYQATLPNYVAEVYFVLDKESVNKYAALRTESTQAERETKAKESLKAEVDYFLTEMNAIFKTLANYGGNSLNIQIRVRKIDVLTRHGECLYNHALSGGSSETVFKNVQEIRTAHPIYDDTSRPHTKANSTNLFSGAMVDVDAGLTTFDKWLATKNAFTTLKYDLAVLLTGFDLWSSAGKEGTAGYAHLAGVCKSDRAAAVAEIDGTYSTVVHTAHEIAHVLGAGHDSNSAGYVMAGSSSASSSNRWSFSISSANEINAVISQLTDNCLSSTNAASVTPNSGATAELTDADTLCARALDSKDSYLCRNKEMFGGVVPKGDVVCKAIYCGNPTQAGYCRKTFSSDGLICDTNKRCNDGTCQDSPDTESAKVNGDCLFGDSRMVKISMNGNPFIGSCTQLISTHGTGMCRFSSIKSLCCATCAQPLQNTGTAGCAQRDKWSTCANFGKTLMCTPEFGYMSNCCNYCQGFSASRSSKRDGGQSVNDLLSPLESLVVVEEIQKKEEESPRNIV